MNGVEDVHAFVVLLLLLAAFVVLGSGCLCQQWSVSSSVV